MNPTVRSGHGKALVSMAVIGQKQPGMVRKRTATFVQSEELGLNRLLPLVQQLQNLLSRNRSFRIYRSYATLYRQTLLYVEVNNVECGSNTNLNTPAKAP